ncbi:MAG TPA: hypothetical protein VGR61_11635 [Candidatus Dormibacteraeota bacterium]|nr:hypothetical protein [Candidatus Dormibacteraeota bacterium]
MADLSMETLYHPPFENDPPLKLNINAKTLGLVLAILYAIFALFSIIGVFGAMGVAALGSALGVHQIFLLIVIGAIAAAIGDILVAWGGYKLYQLNIDGKRFVIMGLALGVVASVFGAIGFENPSGVIGAIIVAGIIYYIVIISRLPSDAPLVTSGGPGPGPGPGTGPGTPPPAV